MRSSTPWTLGTTFSPFTMMEASRGTRRTVCRTARLLRNVDLFSAEHRLDPYSQLGFLDELQQKLEGFVGNGIL